ncbi:MAG: hypothetical protein JSW27_03225, partial [Phycisphaerales bacterium]
MITRMASLSWWQGMGWTMIHFLWIGLLIGLVAFLGRLALRTCRPQIRYLFLTGCFLLMAAAPWPVLRHLLNQPLPMSASIGDSSPPGLSSGQATESNYPEAVVLRTADVPSQALADRQETKARLSRHWSLWLNRTAGLAPWIWVLGTPMTLLFVCCGVAGTRRLRRSSRVLTDDRVVRLSARLHRSLNIGREIAIALSDHVVSPALIGVIKPMILLPPSLITGCTPEQLEMILLHELAHVRRGDAWVNLLQRFVECVLFFHPVIWIVSHWIRAEREACCDDIVLHHTQEPQRYAETLAFLATSHRGLNPMPTLALARHPLVHRIQHILGQDRHTFRFSPLLMIGVTAVLLISLTIGIRTVAAGDAKETKSEQQPTSLDGAGARRIEFPGDRSLGLLSIRDTGTKGWGGWEPFGEARGIVTVPAGKDLMLNVHAEGVDLSPLANLAPEALDELNLTTPTLMDDDLRHVGHIRSLKRVSIRGSHSPDEGQFTGRGLAHLYRLSSLVELHIFRTDLDEAGMEQLASLKSLQRLFLWDNAKMTPAGLAHLKSLPTLRLLSFHQTPVRDEGVTQIRNLDSLEALHLEYADITAEGIQHLVGMTDLRQLSIYAEVPGSALQPLSSLPHLEELTLAEIKMKDADIAMFKAFPALKDLDLRLDELTGEGMRHLRSMSSLEELSGRLPQATNESMQHLIGLNFKALNLDCSEVGDKALEAIGTMVELEQLFVSDTNISDEGLKSLEKLEALRLLRADNTTITDEGIIDLGAKSNMSDLWLRNTKVGDEGFRAIGQMMAMTQLVADNTAVTDAGLAHLGKLHRLRHMNLSRTKITDRGLKHLTGLRGLESLSARDTSVTDVG